MADFIKYAFIAGEVSPTLVGRTDLEKYDLGMALARNWFVDYRGGLSTRPGTQFVDFVKDDDKETRFFPFKFAPSVNSTYVLLFGHNYIRFIQDGEYVLEAAKTITGATKANPCVITAAAHGYSNGDWVRIFDVVGMTQVNQRTFKVANVATNTFELTDPNTGANINSTAYSTYTSGGTVQRIYEIASTYDEADLELLRAHQSRSTIYLTHVDYPTRILTRNSHTSWSLADVAVGNGLSKPTGLAITTATGSAGVGFVVTAVDSEGVESLPSDYVFDSTITDYTQTAGQAKVTWTAVTGAVQYRVYRTNIITTGADVSRAMQVGFIGIAYGTEFIDNNIAPDFTITPPNHYNPFANGRIEHINVTAGGSGYTNASVVSITTSTGSGFVGYPVVNSSGALLAIVIENSGEDYADTDTVSVSIGSSATFSITLGDASGNYPGVSSVFQQRKIYAASTNDPLTVWGSKPAQYENFDTADIILDDDSYEFEIDSDEVAPIRHMLATRSGLVLFSQAGIWQLTGGNGVAVTPTNALADSQSSTGCSTLPPLNVDTDILYVEGKGATVRLLTYNDYSKVFASQDLSILSNHLTDPLNPIKYWAYASDPFKLVYGVRTDGTAVCLTLVKEQNVYGWTSMTTRGLYKDVLAIQEDRTDTVYMMVQRYVNGRYTKMIEKVVRRDFVEVEDAWCVDCGLYLGATYPSAGLSASASAAGTGIVFTATSAVFSSGDVGKVLRVGGGKAIITAFTDSTHVTGTLMRPITAVLPEDPDETPLAALEGEWTLDSPVTSVGGLWHLEGETLKVLADGNVLSDATVTNGTITLATAATRVIAGLGFRCVAQTLPPTVQQAVVEHKTKRTLKVYIRLHDSRGLSLGTRDEAAYLYEMAERTDEAYGEPTRLQNGMFEKLLSGSFDREGQFYIVQENPLPATVLGYVSEVDIGDVDRRGN